jgi:hypothetical protein
LARAAGEHAQMAVRQHDGSSAVVMLARSAMAIALAPEREATSVPGALITATASAAS